jgi:NAD(P)-binding Rossmann-like domain
MLVIKVIVLCFCASSLHSFRIHRARTSNAQSTKLLNVVSRKVQPLTAAVDHNIVGLDAPESVVAKSAKEIDEISEADYVVIGSGIGGLSAAALLSYYGYSVVVLESHYLPGGVAHTFEREGFRFDAGPSLWNGMATRPYNPLREVIELTTTVRRRKLLHRDEMNINKYEVSPIRKLKI